MNKLFQSEIMSKDEIVVDAYLNEMFCKVDKETTSPLGLETLLAINAEASKEGRNEMTENEIEAEIASAHAEK